MNRSLYFQHDADAKSDPNILRMLAVWGYKGYGYYWRIVELMRMERDWTLTFNDLDGIAIELFTNRNETEEFINECIKTYKLFKCRRNKFWSERLKRDMLYIDQQKQALSEAGRMGAAKRYQVAQPQPGHSQAKAKPKGGHGYNTILYNKIEDNIYTAWNEAQIIVHSKKTEEIQKAIQKALKIYDEQQILKAIKNYSIVVKDRQYWFDYKWTLQEFLTRKNSIIKFIDDSCFNNFRNKKSMLHHPATQTGGGTKYG